MSEHALIRDGVVDNVIVTDDSLDQEWFDTLITDQGYDAAIDVSSLDPRPGVGWTYVNGKFAVGVPPETLDVSTSTIPADGTTTSTVTYTTTDSATEVTFTVNGATQTVALASGKAQIQVASSTPDDTITVTAGSLTTTITVEA